MKFYSYITTAPASKGTYYEHFVVQFFIFFPHMKRKRFYVLRNCHLVSSWYIYDCVIVAFKKGATTSFMCRRWTKKKQSVLQCFVINHRAKIWFMIYCHVFSNMFKSNSLLVVYIVWVKLRMVWGEVKFHWKQEIYTVI